MNITSSIIRGVDNEITSLILEELGGLDEEDALVVDEMEDKLPKWADRRDIIEAFKVMEPTFGEYIMGRSGYPTRFEVNRSGSEIVESIKTGALSDGNTTEDSTGKTRIPIPIRSGEDIVEVFLPIDISPEESNKVSEVIRALGSS
jgi:hypothetical protein